MICTNNNWLYNKTVYINIFVVAHDTKKCIALMKNKLILSSICFMFGISSAIANDKDDDFKLMQVF